MVGRPLTSRCGGVQSVAWWLHLLLVEVRIEDEIRAASDFLRGLVETVSRVDPPVTLAPGSDEVDKFGPR